MHVVVVGSGFGGVKAALELSKRQIGKITLITDKSYFLHHATLYATATGKSTEESVIPLHVIFAAHPNVKIVEDTITGFDPHRKLISSQKKDYHYDKLVLALGSVTSFFGIPGMQEHAFGISTLEDVREFQAHIHEEVVQNKLDKEYFVIGGGQTGVELASALNEYLKSLKELYRLKNTASRVTIVEAKKRILPHMSRTASQLVAKRLKKQGIRILVKHKVNSLEDDKIMVEGRLYPTRTAVWASGVVNNPFFKTNAGYFHLSDEGRVNVNPYLEALENVYVIGDNNTVTHSGKAWPALKQATHVAKNIARLATQRAQKPFHAHSVPVGVPVGTGWGYVEWLGLYLSGQSGAVVRRWMELYGYCQIVPYRTALPIWQSHKLTDVDDNL
jgi:NADH dehydrogenase